MTTPSPEDYEDIECLTDISTCNSFAGLPICLTTTTRHKCQISSRVKGSRDGCSTVLRSCVEIGKRPEHSIEHMATPTIARFYSTLRQQASPTKKLKRYILAISCDACRAAICKRDNKPSTAALSKRQALAQQNKTEKAQRKLSVQQIPILNFFPDSILDSDKLDFSPITDTVDPTSTITESLARFHESTASSESFDYSSLKSFLPTSVNGGDTMPLGSENSCYESRFNEVVAFRNFKNTPHAMW